MLQGFLKLSTQVTKTVVIISATDHIAGKTGLSAGLTIYLTKAGGTPASVTPTVSELDSTNTPGLYSLVFTTTHTNTLGEFQLHVTGSGADPLDLKWEVVTYLPGEAVTLQSAQKVDIDTIKTQAVTCAAGVTVLASVGTAATSTAQTGDGYARLGAPAGASVSADIAAVKVDTAAVKVQTDKLAFTVANKVDANVYTWNGTAVTAPNTAGTPVVDVGRINNVVTTPVTTVKAVQGLTTADTIATYTGNTVQTGDAFARVGAPVGASISADIASVKSSSDLTATVSDSIPADGSRVSIRQGIYMIAQFLFERSVSGTTVTVSKVDGSTALFTLTLDDGTSPTSITRAT